MIRLPRVSSHQISSCSASFQCSMNVYGIVITFTVFSHVHVTLLLTAAAVTDLLSLQ